MKACFAILGAATLISATARAQFEEEPITLKRDTYRLNVGTGLASNRTYDDQKLRVRSGGGPSEMPITVVGSNSTAFKLEMESWDHSIGLLYVAPHTFQFREIDASWDASQLTLYNNLNFRYGRFVSMIGLNVSYMDARSKSPAYSIQRAATDLGWNVGFGWRLTERLNVDGELTSNRVNFDLRRNADGQRYHWVQGQLITSALVLAYAVN